MVPARVLICSAVALAMAATVSASSVPLPGPGQQSIIDQMSENEEVAYRIKMAIKAAKQVDHNIIQETVRHNFLNSLYIMANASAVTGTMVSRSAATLIRGFVQDSFNLGSVGWYLPRLIFLDGPSQFIETLRLVRTNQIRIPMDMDSAIDTLINFATSVRDSPVVNNVANPFLGFFPNVFRGAETLAGDVLFNVFAWLAPINPEHLNPNSANTLANRWDVKETTTRKIATSY